MKMKKINFLLNIAVFVLAVLLLGGSTIPVWQFQMQALSLGTASNRDGNLSGVELFDNQGYYAIGKSDLKVGTVVQFFGHDWWVVYLNSSQNVATFWMADPYARSAFNTVSASYDGIHTEGNNIWSNGYTSSIWNFNTADDSSDDVTLPQSLIRGFLSTEANMMLNNRAYAKYKDKVVAGYVEGSNVSNVDAKQDIPYLAYAKTSVKNVTVKNTKTNELKADYSLSSNDIWWLPSYGEVYTIWNLDDASWEKNMLGWTETTVSNYAWLRTPACIDDANEQKKGQSNYAFAVSYTNTNIENESNPILCQIGAECGVRPAIHLNIADIEEEYQKHVEYVQSNNSWFNNDWLKALFIGVCVMGLVGVTLIIIVAIAKNKRHAE